MFVRIPSFAFIAYASLLSTVLGAAPADPPVSSYAPAAAIAAQLNEYAQGFETALASAEAFKEGQTRLKRDANTAIVLAIALGLHDEEHPLKRSAPAILSAAGGLAKAGDYDAAQQPFASLQRALKGEQTEGLAPKWEKIASLGQLMKQVTFINNRLKRGARPGPRFKDQADENARLAAVLAVIGQATSADTHEVKDPSLTDQWHAQSASMRDAAGELAKAFAAGDAAAAGAGLKTLEKSCNDCHKTFRVETAE